MSLVIFFYIKFVPMCSEFAYNLLSEGSFVISVCDKAWSAPYPARLYIILIEIDEVDCTVRSSKLVFRDAVTAGRMVTEAVEHYEQF